MFLSSDDPADIARIISAFPEFAEYYRDIAEFRKKPEELVNMFSKVLAELDRDEYVNMMEQLREETINFAEQVRGLQAQCLSLTKKARSLSDSNRSLEDCNRSLEDRNQSLEEENRKLRELLQSRS